MKAPFRLVDRDEILKQRRKFQGEKGSLGSPCVALPTHTTTKTV